MTTPDQRAPEDMTDDELRVAYMWTSQDVGDPAVERLIPEMQRRDLEF